MNGNEIIVGTVSGGVFTAIAAVKSHEVQTQCDTIEYASATDAEWKEFVAGKKEWTVTCNYLVLNDAECNIEDVLKVGTEVLLKVKDRSGNYDVQGGAVVATCRQSFQRGGISNGSFQFKGTGELGTV